MGRYHQSKPKKPGELWVFIWVVMLIFLTAVGIWFYYYHTAQTGGVTETVSRPLPLPSSEQTAIGPESPQTALPTEEAESDAVDQQEPEQAAVVVLPELEASDEWVRAELLRLNPALAPWLKYDQLLRKFLVIVNDFSEGSRSTKHMRFLKPEQPFAAVQEPNGLFMAEAGYHRFDALARTIDGLNVEAAMAFYKKIKPLLQQIYSEFSYPESYRLEDLFLKAGAEILAAPVVTGRIPLIRPSVHYKFADPKTEALNGVHKQMLRLGPDNTRLIQNKVRKLVEALAATGE